MDAAALPREPAYLFLRFACGHYRQIDSSMDVQWYLHHARFELCYLCDPRRGVRPSRAKEEAERKVS